jgi:hypothetical protein
MPRHSSSLSAVKHCERAHPAPQESARDELRALVVLGATSSVPAKGAAVEEPTGRFHHV